MDYRVIKENDLFLLTNLSGDIPENQSQGFGLYTKDTRFLSLLELRINGQKPIVLMSEADKNYISTILLTNPHMEKDGQTLLWRESIEIERTRFIYQNVLYEMIRATNLNPYQCSFDLSLSLDADFADMFTVRGFKHKELGQKKGKNYLGNNVSIEYCGSDSVHRALKVSWTGFKGETDPKGNVIAHLSLQAGESSKLVFTIMPVINGVEPPVVAFDEALAQLQSSYDEWEQQSTTVNSDHRVFNRMYSQGLLDIRVLLTDLGFGNFPVAGLPWFAVPFGRDSLITALQMLPIAPSIAAGTIRTMARFQGTKIDSWRDEQPGKIMHELRNGELANTNQVPFTPYYGTIDATPLFLVLMAEYVKWTDDFDLIQELMPNIEAALSWIDYYGDRDGSRLVSYYQESTKGLANQGWKDSADSLIHENGDYAIAPIKLVEVQGYVHLAKCSLAEVFRVMAEKKGSMELEDFAKRLEEEAEELRVAFESAFWMEDKDYYAIALDFNDTPVRSVTSNPGHGLLSDLYSSNRASVVVEKIVSKELFSGFGIRTKAEGEKGYNPMSYHNGSVWPHDNSIILMGLAKHGFQNESKVVMEGLLQAAEYFENGRLPELFCGYPKEKGRPVRYPVACSPQAWAAGTPLTFITAMMGLRLEFSKRKLRLNPVLPDGMTRLMISNMRLGSGLVSLVVYKTNDSYEIEILENTSGWLMNVESHLIIEK